MTAFRDFARPPTRREDVGLSCSWATARRVPAVNCCSAQRHAIVSQSRWRELDADYRKAGLTRYGVAEGAVKWLRA